jgi:hypothetical protein
MQTSKTSKELIARRPAAEKAIADAQAAIRQASSAKEAALESEDRKAYDAARYDLERSELALTKAKKALQQLDSDITAATEAETRIARDAALAARDAKLDAATKTAKAEAQALLEALKHRLARQELTRSALEHQAVCERLTGALGEKFFAKKNIDASVNVYEAARELHLLVQRSDTDPQLRSLAGRLILDIAPNFHAPSVAV